MSVLTKRNTHVSNVEQDLLSFPELPISSMLLSLKFHIFIGILGNVVCLHGFIFFFLPWRRHSYFRLISTNVPLVSFVLIYCLFCDCLCCLYLPVDTLFQSWCILSLLFSLIDGFCLQGKTAEDAFRVGYDHYGVSVSEVNKIHMFKFS